MTDDAGGRQRSDSLVKMPVGGRHTCAQARMGDGGSA